MGHLDKAVVHDGMHHQSNAQLQIILNALQQGQQPPRMSLSIHNLIGEHSNTQLLLKAHKNYRHQCETEYESICVVSLRETLQKK